MYTFPEVTANVLHITSKALSSISDAAKTTVGASLAGGPDVGAVIQRLIQEDKGELTLGRPDAPESDVGLTAKAYMRQQGMDREPTPQVEVGGDPDTGGMGTWRTLQGEGEGASVKAADDVAESNRLATLELNHIDKIKQATADPVEQLRKIKERLGVVGQPINEPSPDAALKARATSNYNYSAGEGQVQTTHRVSITDAKGKPAGEVTAVAPKDSPNDWQIDRVEAAQKQGTGSSAYRELFKAAQKQADSTGETVTVRQGGVQSPEAQNLWQSTLKKQGYTPEGGKMVFKPTVQ
jgi:hypothetical protein